MLLVGVELLLVVLVAGYLAVPFWIRKEECEVTLTPEQLESIDHAIEREVSALRIPSTMR